MEAHNAHDADEPTAELDRRFAEERAVWERSLIAQEHRLIPAIGNLIGALLHKDPAEKRQLVPIAAMALGWCLVPSPATAGVGIVALLSLLLSWQQIHLLQIQNDRIQTQNILAEAQRRSGLVFETTAVLELVNTEKNGAEWSHDCSPTTSPCWRESKGDSSLFIPSRATLGRLAAQTQALRPYRYLSVETKGPYRLLDSKGQKSICPEEIVNTELSRIVFGQFINRDNASPSALSPEGRAAIAEKYRLRPHTNGWRRFIERFNPSRLLDPPLSPRAQAELNCSPSSPERGQLLVSLHAAQVDLSEVVRAGADFTYADAPGANLKGIRMDGVDLSFARLPGARFTEGSLRDVTFRDADLAGATFTRASLDDVNFEGTTLQRFGESGAFATFFFVRDLSPRTLAGVRLVESAEQVELFKRFCVAGRLSLRSAHGPIEIARRTAVLRQIKAYALVTEEAPKTDGAPPLRVAYFVPSLGDQTATLYSPGRGNPTVTYQSFSQCNWPP